jgi:anti-anti-sigma regulatory factor
MLKIERIANGDVVLTVAGELERGNACELLRSLAEETEGRTVILDLKNLVLVDRSAVRHLQECEARGILLRNCPSYVRIWIASKMEVL